MVYKVKWTIFIFFLFSSFMAKAHQPDLSSTFLVEQEKGEWIVHIRSALTAFEYEVNTNFGIDSYKTPKEFKELVIEHIKENVKIQFEDDEVDLTSPMVQLGHETNIVFKIVNRPWKHGKLHIQNRAFQNINKNQSALIVQKKGLTQNQFFLNQRNNHQVSLEVKDSQIQLIGEAEPNDKVQQCKITSKVGLLKLGIVGSLLFVFFLYRKSNIQ